MERKLFLEDFIPLVIAEYENIAKDDDNIKLNYYSQLNNNPFPALLAESGRKIYIQKEPTAVFTKTTLNCLWGKIH